MRASSPLDSSTLRGPSTGTYQGGGDPWWGPVARWAVLVGLDLICQVAFKVRVRGVSNFMGRPATILAITHRRDSDTLVATGPILDRRGLRLRGPLPFFVSREDLLRPHFFRDYPDRLPGRTRSLIGRFPLAPVLWACGARPMRRVPERTLREVLEDVLLVRGDLPLDEVLRERALARYHEWPGICGDGMGVRDALEDRFRPLLGQRYGLTRLRRSFFKELKPYERDVIHAQLTCFEDLLRAGEMLVLAPEGVISPDGSVSRIRGALHQLVNTPGADVRVLPVGITYDFMTTGRLGVFVDFGPELVGLGGRSHREITELARDALLRRLTVTATQLASEFLTVLQREGTLEVDAPALTSRVGEQALAYDRAGAPVDPRLLAAAPLRRRITRLLRWCVHQGALVLLGGDHYGMRGDWETARPDWRDSRGAFGYATNELAGLSEVYPARSGIS